MKNKTELTIEERIELKSIGSRIASIKESLGWDTADLAKAAGIDRSNCKKIENGENNTSMAIIYAIIQTFGILPNEFFNEEYELIRKSCIKECEAELLITEDVVRNVDRKKVIGLMKKYRKRRGMSQMDLADELGATRNFINNFEYGRGKIDRELLISLNKATNISTEEFIKMIGVRI